MSDFPETSYSLIERVHDLANDGKSLFAAWETVVRSVRYQCCRSTVLCDF